MKRTIPGALWISISTLGAISAIQLLIGVQNGSGVLLLTVVVNVALVAGLLLGHKWAYVATLVLSIGGVIVALGKNSEQVVGVLIGNGLVIVPMIVSTRFFFHEKPKSLDAEQSEVQRV